MYQKYVHTYGVHGYPLLLCVHMDGKRNRKSPRAKWCLQLVSKTAVVSDSSGSLPKNHTLCTNQLKKLELFNLVVVSVRA